MNKENWAIFEPRLKECNFGDAFYSDSNNVIFIGKTNDWYQYGEAYLLWDKIHSNILVYRLEDDEELAWNEKIKRYSDEITAKREAKKGLPWWNINKYL